MRINITSALASLSLAGGLGTASLLGMHGDEPIGEYPTPGGTLIVFQDRTASWEPDEDVILGRCWMDDTNASTGEWHEPIYACAPMVAPDGKALEQAFPDDGSAFYPESAYGFDGEDRAFRQH